MSDSFLEDLTGRTGLLDADPLELPEPDGGDRTLRHDPEFVALDNGLSGIRDTINRGVDVLNGFGAGLPKLPEGSLEDLLVRPLTGDYVRIRQNAAATHHVRDALSTYGGNVVRLSLGVDPRWGGAAASSYLVRLQVQAVAARGLGEVVARGSVVFDEIADYSERLAVRVEGLVMELVERGRRLVTKVLTRLLGPGAVALAAEIALKGIDVVTDIVEDVQRVIEIVETLLRLRDEVAAWVEEQRARLEVFLDLLDVVLGRGADLRGGGGGSW
ncbi:hypothetical protein HNR19_003457 [Nocardioides thalensis]|uniref:Uncharacterized protein n=1 Tax=Nocardioides thalensis TaxID=1914755 RepID=A0A853C678_9ACTN|nr:hypothetical protein [Nocardioides thalensis]NYJ02759.1 hypothetical protein [Nocardioides thalensis]